jgi:N6-L-threonylcarbamoyladenine synthase
VSPLSLIIGIDTSCYTTSLAVVDRDGKLVYQDKKLLKVVEGERGLQQSAGVFQHLSNLPQMIERLFQTIEPKKISLIGVSSRPRPIEDSYMPVFKVGEGFGQALSSSLQVPMIRTSHQEGHVMAGIWSALGPTKDNFLCVHLSGGTSELLLIEKNKSNEPMPKIFEIKLLGATKDLHAGQFVDRVGVALGLPFPAGPSLEELATQSSNQLQIPSYVKGFRISFSGPESAALRLIQQGENKAEIARAVESCIAKTLEKVLKEAIVSLGIKDILIVGGVAANTFLRERLKNRLEHKAIGANLYFAKPEYSTDNALGTAIIAKEFRI